MTTVDKLLMTDVIIFAFSFLLSFAYHERGKEGREQSFMFKFFAFPLIYSIAMFPVLLILRVWFS